VQAQSNCWFGRAEMSGSSVQNLMAVFLTRYKMMHFTFSRCPFLQATLNPDMVMMVVMISTLPRDTDHWRGQWATGSLWCHWHPTPQTYPVQDDLLFPEKKWHSAWAWNQKWIHRWVPRSFLMYFLEHMHMVPTSSLTKPQSRWKLMGLYTEAWTDTYLAAWQW